MSARYDVDSIPDELKVIPRWCGFQIVQEPGGKTKKLPLVSGVAGRVLAKCNDASTLRPFDVARRDAELRGLYLAFAFDAELPFFFIDADNVWSGESIRDDVRVVRDALDTYTEISASGTGLHIIGRGAFPEHAANREAPEGGKPLERYPLHGGRFCVLTGDVLPGFGEIHERGDVLARLFPSRPMSTNGHTAYEGATGELTQSEGEAIVRWTAPYWTDGRRHAMALHLSGYLGKQGVSRAQAVRIIEQCAVHDGDPGAKVHACHDSYDALEAGGEVSGWRGLVDVCGLTDAQVAPVDAVLSGFWKRTHPQVEPTVNGAGPDALPVYRMADEIPPERISWVWYGFLAEGKITILDGVPKLGKSTLTADFAARITHGLPFPGLAMPRSARGVVMLSAEDGAADTIVPRLTEAGADLGKVAIVDGVPLADGTEGWIHLDEHLALIEALARKIDAQLIVIDPLVAYLGQKNAYKDQDMRAVLGPVKAMAERTGCAVIIIRHLNKTASTDIIVRGGGTVGISGAARLGMLVARDPENDDARILAQSVTNLTRELPSLRFAIEGIEDTDVARIVWDDEPAPYTSLDLLEAPPDAEEKGARGEAMEFLRDALADGERDKIAVLKDARKLGIAERTLRRAKEALGVQSVKHGGGEGGYWAWVPPVGWGNTRGHLHGYVTRGEVSSEEENSQGGHVGPIGNVGPLKGYDNQNWPPLKQDDEGGQRGPLFEDGHGGHLHVPWDSD